MAKYTLELANKRSRDEISCSFSRLLSLAFLVCLGVGAPNEYAFAKKTNQALYEDPFDLAAGGASLTRASQVGLLFSNPAQLSLSNKIHRWLGSESIVVVNKESYELLNEMTAGSKSSSSEEEVEEGGAGGSAGNADFIEKLFKNPFYAGVSNNLSYINRAFGVAAFQRFNVDLRARRYGETGLPEISVQAESYMGAIVGMPIWTPFKWLALGASAKYVLASEPELTVEITDEEKIGSLRDPSAIQKLGTHNRGLGIDAGALLMFPGKHLDYTFALKADDIGDTKLAGDHDLSSFKQVISVGAGMTLHTGGDGLHLSIDYRDIQNTYEEELFKKIYMGAKLTIRSYVGLAAGLYNGYPTMGAEVDLIVARISGTYYTREMGKNAGAEPRNIYMLSLAMGI